MNISFRNTKTNEYFHLPANWKEKSNAIESNVDIQEGIFVDGGRNVAYKKIKSRSITISGKYKYNENKEDAKLEANVYANKLIAFLYKAYGNCEMYINNYYKDKGIVKFYRGVYLSSYSRTDIIFSDYIEISLTINIEDPYLYYYHNSYLEVIVNNEQEFTVFNSSLYDIYPIFEIQLLSDNNVTLSFINKIDNRKSELNNRLFKMNDIISIDSEKGLVLWNNGFANNYFNMFFPILYPNENIFLYTGGGQIKINIYWFNKDLY